MFLPLGISLNSVTYTPRPFSHIPNLAARHESFVPQGGRCHSSMEGQKVVNSWLFSSESSVSTFLSIRPLIKAELQDCRDSTGSRYHSFTTGDVPLLQILNGPCLLLQPESHSCYVYPSSNRLPGVSPACQSWKETESKSQVA